MTMTTPGTHEERHPFVGHAAGNEACGREECGPGLFYCHKPGCLQPRDAACHRAGSEEHNPAETAAWGRSEYVRILPAPTTTAGPKRSEYEPKSAEQRVAYLVEECGEVLAAAGKSLRWGLDSSNPELPPEQRETNRAWLLRELADLKAAIQRCEEGL